MDKSLKEQLEISEQNCKKAGNAVSANVCKNNKDRLKEAIKEFRGRMYKYEELLGKEAYRFDNDIDEVFGNFEDNQKDFYVSNISFYDRALSEEEIKNLYDKGK